MYYSLHRIGLNRGRTYIDSPSWIKHKKASINLKAKDNKCFRDSTVAILNHKQIKYNPEKISNPMSFTDQCNWEGIEFPSHPRDWKKIEQNNKAIAVNVLYVAYNTKQIR